MKANAEVEISHPQSRLKSVSSKLGGILRPPASELSACVLASIFINLEFEMTASVVWHDITVQSFFETTASVCCVARYNCTVCSCMYMYVSVAFVEVSRLRIICHVQFITYVAINHLNV